MFGRRKTINLKVQESDLYIVVDKGMTHAHGPYNNLEQAVKLAVMESRKSGQPHLPVAFDFTTGVVIKPEQLEAAVKEVQGKQSETTDTRGYL